MTGRYNASAFAGLEPLAATNDIIGTAGNDVINTTAGDDAVSALEGFDFIRASSGFDTIDGGADFDQVLIDPSRASFEVQTTGRDYMITDDILSSSDGALNTGISNVELVSVSTANAGNFDDTFDASLFTLGGVNLSLGSGTTSVVGTGQDDRVTLRGGASTVDLGLGLNDLVQVGAVGGNGEVMTLATNQDGSISVNSTNGDNYSLSNVDQIYVFAAQGNDRTVDASGVTGGSLDLIQFFSDAGDETFIGSQQADQFYFSDGSDSFTGGAGADVYFITSLGTQFSPASEVAIDGDIITDMGFDDTIDFSATQFNDPVAATFIGSGAFTGTSGQIRYQVTGGNTLIQADNNGDGISDATLTIIGEFDVNEGNSSVLEFSPYSAPNTITGTSGDDFLSGTLGDDAIDALAGNDGIQGSDGTDTIDGGAGDFDRLSFNFYDDNAFQQIATGRNITITDTTLVDASSNVSTTFTGIEFLDLFVTDSFGPGGLKDDLADTIDASATTLDFTNFLVRGGNDTILGGSGDNRISTRLWEDVRSQVYFDGGAGYDISSIGIGTTATDVTLVATIEANGDTLVTSSLGDTYRYTDVEEFFLFNGGGSGPSVDFDFSVVGQKIVLDFTPFDAGFPDRNISILAGSGDDELLLGVGDDNAEGGAGDDRINGGDGNDRLLGDDGNDVIRGENGDDTLTGGAGDDVLIGGLGVDRLSGQDGNDSLTGNSGADIIFGGLGNDSIFSGGDDDLVNGNAGDDSIAASQGNDTVFGGGGADDINGGSGNDSLYGQAGDDTIFGSIGDDYLSGGSGNDYLNGGSGADRLYANNGDDTLFGTDGDDILNGGAGADTLFGGNDNDVVSGGDQGDDVRGGAGDDRLFGNAGEDRLFGDDGNDRLDGGDQGDNLFGGAGNDVLTGGGGQDRFSFTDGWGDDRITDFANNGVEKINLVAVSGATSLAQLAISDTAGGALIEYDGNSILLTGLAAADLDDSDFIFAPTSPLVRELSAGLAPEYDLLF